MDFEIVFIKKTSFIFLADLLLFFLVFTVHETHECLFTHILAFYTQTEINILTNVFNQRDLP